MYLTSDRGVKEGKKRKNLPTHRVKIKFGRPVNDADNLLRCRKKQEEITAIGLRLYYLCSAFLDWFTPSTGRDMPVPEFLNLGPEDLYKANYIIQEAQ